VSRTLLAAAAAATAWDWADLAHQPELRLDQPTGAVSDPIGTATNIGTAGNTFTAAGALRPLVALINSVKCYDFQSGQYMGSTLTVGDVYGAPEYHCFCVIDIDAIAAASDSVNNSSNENVFAAMDYTLGLSLKYTGTLVEAYHLDAASTVYVEASASGLALGTPALVEWSYDGTTLRARVGAGATATGAGTRYATYTSALRLGASPGGTKIDGRIAELVCSKVRYTGADLTNIRNYYATTYGVTV
jgi:hypothetical protein